MLWSTHGLTTMDVRAAWGQLYDNLIIILSQQLLLLDAQHTQGEYKTIIPTLLLTTGALRGQRNQQLYQDHSYQA